MFTRVRTHTHTRANTRPPTRTDTLRVHTQATGYGVDGGPGPGSFESWTVSLWALVEDPARCQAWPASLTIWSNCEAVLWPGRGGERKERRGEE